ncbi:hypothetical protein F4859DRAFT_459974 [Xylaria cf. heliscus]|nr:hypothetical protein F4859DRAFT_459974 [Xylaria cf. heliscus]
MDRSKQSRRFACDRCRIYKLRCERVSAEGNNCRRCIRFGIFCATTNAQDCGARNKTSQRRSAHTLFSERAMMTPQSSTSMASGTAPSQRIAPSPVGAQANNVLGFDLCSDRCPSDLMLPDFDFIDMGENQDSPHSYDEITGSVSALGGLQDSSDLVVDITATKDLQGRPKSGSGHRNLLELSANLVDDIDRLDSLKNRQGWSANPGFLETTTQRALSQTSELLDILKKLAIEGEEDKVHDCASDASVPQHSGTESSSRHQDILFASTLVTSYILIARYWHKLFSYISRLHVEERTKSLPILPALFFGGIQATANLDIQFIILLETCSSMIQLVEAYLGVSSSCVMRFSETAIEAKTLLKDPISISMRETMLSVEVLHNARRDGAPPLKEIMKAIQEHIFRRRRI